MYTFLSATINAAGVRYAVKYAIELTKNDPIPYGMITRLDPENITNATAINMNGPTSFIECVNPVINPNIIRIKLQVLFIAHACPNDKNIANTIANIQAALNAHLSHGVLFFFGI